MLSIWIGLSFGKELMSLFLAAHFARRLYIILQYLLYDSNADRTLSEI